MSISNQLQLEIILADLAYEAHASSATTTTSTSKERVESKLQEYAKAVASEELSKQLANIEILDSNQDMVAFKLPNSNEAIVAFRGTIIGSRDLLNDASILLTDNAFATRLQSATSFINKLQKENPNLTLKTVGHSLGGSIANAMANSFKLKATVFNPGRKPTGMYGFLSPYGSDTEVHIIKGDIISSRLNVFGNNVTKHASSPDKSAHSLSNYLDMIPMKHNITQAATASPNALDSEQALVTYNKLQNIENNLNQAKESTANEADKLAIVSAEIEDLNSVLQNQKPLFNAIYGYANAMQDGLYCSNVNNAIIQQQADILKHEFPPFQSINSHSNISYLV